MANASSNVSSATAIDAAFGWMDRFVAALGVLVTVWAAIATGPCCFTATLHI